MRNHINFYLNDEWVRLDGKEVFMTLAEWLRYRKAKTGTKIVCAEGDCGACSVLCGELDNKGKLQWKVINSCITFPFLHDGQILLTIEGLLRENQLSEVQQAMVDCHGGQCGFCTPGFVMAMEEHFNRQSNHDVKKIKNSLTGNLCRCTGYFPILAAAEQVAEKNPLSLSERFSSQDKIENLKRTQKNPYHLIDHKLEAFSPDNVYDAFQFKRKYKDVNLISGATDLGVQINKNRIHPTKFLSLNKIQDLYSIELQENGVRIGAKVTFDRLQRAIANILPEFARFIDIFASPQIKSSATLVGNIVNASPIADSPPFLIAAGSVLEIEGPGGKHKVPLENFYRGYKDLDLDHDEIVTHVFIPFQPTDAIVKIYKASQRRDMDIACVNSAFIFRVSNQTILDAKIVYGGVAATTYKCRQTEKFLIGKKWQADTLKLAGEEALKEMTPLSDVRGSEQFRKVLVKNFMKKSFYDIGANP